MLCNDHRVSSSLSFMPLYPISRDGGLIIAGLINAGPASQTMD